MNGWQMISTEGAPTYIRTCARFTAVPVSNKPAIDLCGALPAVDRFGLAMYAESPFKAILAQTLERSAGAIDLGNLTAMYRREKRQCQVALVQGDIVVAKGRTDPELFGGPSRLLHDCRRWEAGELKAEPVQVKRLKELEAAGADVIELQTNAAVDLRFSRVNLAQPVVICRERFRQAELTERVKVKWL